eukprot:COSAG01_NODE_1527_length_10015_cov_79.013312_6_plen_42_part_00
MATVVETVGRGGEWVFVCRCEQCGELWCRLVQAGMWKGGGV